MTAAGTKTPELTLPEARAANRDADSEELCRAWERTGCGDPEVAVGLLVSGNEGAWAVLRAIADGPVTLRDTFSEYGDPRAFDIASALLPLVDKVPAPGDQEIIDALDRAKLYGEVPVFYYLVVTAGANRAYRAWRKDQPVGEREPWRFAEEVFLRLQVARAESRDATQMEEGQL